MSVMASVMALSRGGGGGRQPGPGFLLRPGGRAPPGGGGFLHGGLVAPAGTPPVLGGRPPGVTGPAPLVESLLEQLRGADLQA